MEIVQIPVEVLALIDGEWWRVVGIATEAELRGFVAVQSYEGENRVYPPAESFKWDLLWPKGIAPDVVFL